MKTLRMLAWPIAVIVVALVAGGIFIAIKLSELPPPVSIQVEENNTQVIEAVTRTEEVVLLSLGIQGIKEHSRQTPQVWGVTVPGLERAVFIQYQFRAKLGISGRDVQITELEDGSYRITIPSFIFIGHQDPKFSVATESGGILSWLTPEIDHLAIVNSILDDEAKLQYLADNEDILKDQARSFYTRIVHSIDPTAVLEFEFRDLVLEPGTQ